MPGKDLPETDPHLLRQLWGLAVLCERGLRVIAPHWQALSAGWGDEAAARMFRRITFPVSWLCQLAAGSENEDTQSSLPEPVIRLLASSVATILKASRVAGFHADFLLPSCFVNIPVIRRSTSMHAAAALLLPRMAGAASVPRFAAGGSSNAQGGSSSVQGGSSSVQGGSSSVQGGSSSVQGASSSLLCAGRAVDIVLRMSQCGGYDSAPLMLLLGSLHMTTITNRASSELLHCSGPATTRGDTHFVVGMLSYYVVFLSTHIAFAASQGFDGGAASGSSELRNLLYLPSPPPPALLSTTRHPGGAAARHGRSRFASLAARLGILLRR